MILDILRSPVHVSIESKRFILPKVTFCSMSSPIVKLDYFWNTCVLTATCFDPIASRSLRLPKLVALKTEDTKITAHMRFLKVRQRIFFFAIQNRAPRIFQEPGSISTPEPEKGPRK